MKRMLTALPTKALLAYGLPWLKLSSFMGTGRLSALGHGELCSYWVCRLVWTEFSVLPGSLAV